jgi:hypothetical protein
LGGQKHAQQIAQRRVGRGSVGLETAALEQIKAVSARLCLDLRGETRLTDPRLTAQKYDPTLTSANLCQRGVQRS